MFLFMFTLVVVGMAVYTYQQVAAVTREAARYAIVHGAQWANDINSGTLTTPQDIFNNAIVPAAVGLDTKGMSFYQSGGNGDNLTLIVSYDNSSQVATFNDSSGNPTMNYVSVTISYTWYPPLFPGGMTVASKSVMPMQY
jgi:hypothetical protein